MVHNGDPLRWNQFWEAFKVTIHEQPIPDIQKLNYLLIYLRGRVYAAVGGYSITPAIIKGTKIPSPQELKNLAPAARKADLRTFLENTETILRQLEEQGEDSSHPEVEILIEEKLPNWILNELLKYKLADPKIIHLKGEIARIHFDKANQRPKELNRFQPARNSITSSQLATVLAKIQMLREYGVHPSRIPRQPCIFCSGHDWNDNHPQCRNRAQPLQQPKECHLCCRCCESRLDTVHCQISLRCFHRKQAHHTALCQQLSSKTSNEIPHSAAHSPIKPIQAAPLRIAATVTLNENSVENVDDSPNLVITAAENHSNPARTQKERPVLLFPQWFLFGTRANSTAKISSFLNGFGPRIEEKLEEIIHLKGEIARIHFDKANQRPKELNRFQPARNSINSSQLATVLAKTQMLREYGVHPSRIPRQPCIFCSSHDWNDNYPQCRNRAQPLQQPKECHLCCRCCQSRLDAVHCQISLRCFHRKQAHHTALCPQLSSKTSNEIPHSTAHPPIKPIQAAPLRIAATVTLNENSVENVDD
uniref:Uncharacterized protein n=1 Tax=Ascaris lumbricoides TaxID=6252 RepID=A0A0M3HS20_ASCLU